MDKEEAQIIRMAANVLVDDVLMNDIGPRLTCFEAETLARMIELALGNDYAMLFIREHARGDDDPEDMHYSVYARQ